METTIRLLNVPLEADYKHTIYFDSPEAQEGWFSSKTFKTFTECSYQRKDKKIRVPLHYDDVANNCNYVMYKNSNNGKWYYAFITNIEYINEDVTDVFIETDVMQTWLFDYTLKSCFVEREHTSDDTVGYNTVPENLETGEYICNNVFHDSSTDSTVYIVASTVDIGTGKDSGIRIYNGVVTGWYYYVFNTKEEISTSLGDISELRTNDCIVNIFIMPKAYIHTTTNNIKVTESWDIPKSTVWEDIKKPTKVDGYTPLNNKVLTYPYSYLLVDNNSGGVATYKYELFNLNNGYENNNNCDFVIKGCITPGGSLRLLPNWYNNSNGVNNHYGLNGGKFPVCAWQSDYYTNWLTQNSLNLEVQAETIELTAMQGLVNNTDGALSSAQSLVSGDIAGGLIGGAKTIANGYFIGKQQANQIKGMVAQKQMHAFQSPTVSGAIASGDINYCMGNIRFSAYQMSIRKEYAKIIDGYFHMYGYQVNRVKVPEEKHRQRFWYTKTIGCEIDGAIPNTDMQVIKACYDNGITFWTDPNGVGKYCDKNNDLLANIIV